MKKHCNQCNRWKDRRQFVGPKGKEREKNCNACTAKYNGHAKKTIAEKIAAMPKRPRPTLPRVLWIATSQNRKLGEMPVSITEERTCPPSCMFFDAACYASYGQMALHWRRAPKDGLTWEAFLDKVRALPEGTLWRHNEAGDLPGEGDCLDVDALQNLVLANGGRRGFTYTHKPLLSKAAQQAVSEANTLGFTINLSADSIVDADFYATYWRGVGPVVLTVAEDAELPKYTENGHKLVECPAQTHEMTCAECELCAKPNRKSIVVFRAHGQGKAFVTELVRRKRSAA